MALWQEKNKPENLNKVVVSDFNTGDPLSIDSNNQLISTSTDNHTDVALGKISGAALWNKFGYNEDIDIGTEVIASWGGTFEPLTTATTLSIVSTSTDDDNGGTGTNSLVIYGIDSNRDEVIEVVTLNGTTPVVTTSTWLGTNRLAMFLCGTGKTNAGIITVTAVTGGSTMAQMPTGGGVSQQCIFHIPRNYQFIMKWMRINVLNRNKDAELLFKFWVYSPTNNGNQEVYRMYVDTSKTNDISEDPQLPFPITPGSVIWLECTSNKADVSVSARFSGELFSN